MSSTHCLYLFFKNIQFHTIFIILWHCKTDFTLTTLHTSGWGALHREPKCAPCSLALMLLYNVSESFGVSLTLVYCIPCVSVKTSVTWVIPSWVSNSSCRLSHWATDEGPPYGFGDEPRKTVLQAAAWQYGILKVIYFQTLSTKFAWS